MAMKKKTLLLMLVCFCLLIIVILYWFKPFAPRATGTYLIDGGTGYLVISRTPLGKLTINSEQFDRVFQFQVGWQHYRQGMPIRKVKQSGSTLAFLLARERPTAPFSSRRRTIDTYVNTLRKVWEKLSKENVDLAYMEFVPSQTIRGDWDLVAYCPGDSYDAALQYYRLQKPSPSYLHRIDDPRIPELFGYLNNGEEYGDKALTLAKELLQEFLNDPYVVTLNLMALFKKGNVPEAENLYQQWREQYAKSQDAFLRVVARRIEHQLLYHHLAQTDDNAYDFMENLFADHTDLQTRLEQFPEILNNTQYVVASKSFRPYDFVVPNFLELQVHAKVVRTIAAFRLLEGKREQARDLLTATYHLGKVLNESDHVIIARLIGVAIRNIATRGLEIYGLNACETNDDFLEFWTLLDQLATPYHETTFKQCATAEFPLVDYLPKTTHVGLHVVEMEIREKVADASFALLRLATAAKYAYVTTGNFPKSATDFAPLLPNGPPKDPFSPAQLQFINREENEQFVCYSLGPDQTDDLAEIPYDPTNGTMSPGDLIITTPRERQFPFPQEGVKAQTAEEVRGLFPQGLPLDPFARTPGKSLSISNTSPVYVYSYGPDTNEREALQYGEQYIPEVVYDPTNGVVSYGDLFIQLPTE